MKRLWLIGVVVGFGIALVGGCASSGGEHPAADPVPSQEASETPSPAATKAAQAEPLSNTLRWTTASEVANFGFDVYRGLSEEGPFERITSEPIAGAGTTDEPQDYVFLDEEIDPSRNYFYYIESISFGGVRERFSPIIRSPAKKPVDDSQD